MIHRRSILCATVVFLVISPGCRSRSYHARAASSVALGSNAKYTLTIDPAQAGNIDEAMLRQATEQAIELFESRIAPLREPLVLNVGVSGCLRTGYSFADKKINYCANTNTPHSGTASVDVVHHETFHAMSCQLRPEWCSPEFLEAEDNVALQEGLADAFSHQLAPDNFFGEGFYDNAPFVRKYRTDVCYNLVEGSHQKGNAVASKLIKENFDWASLATFFAGPSFNVEALVGGNVDPCFKADGPHLAVVPENYPASTLERFRIQKDLPLVLNFNPDAALKARFPTLKVRWETVPTLFSIKETAQANGDQRFTVSVTGDKGWEKAVALYEAGGTVVGSESFYFTIKK